MKVVLHIGPHKTGTTSIQRFLHANARALKKRGIVYPAAWDGGYNHHVLAHGLRMPSLYADTVCRIAKELEAASRNRMATLVLSSEMLVEEGAPIDRLAEVFGGCELHVLAYIRRPDHQWASAYAQLVIEASVRRQSGIEEAPVPYDCSLAGVFPKWMAHFPPSRMTIAPFDPPQWFEGSLERDFLRTIGASDSAIRACSYQNPPQNPSLPASVLDLLRVANASPMSGAAHVRLVEALEALAREFAGVFGPPPRLSSMEAAKRAFDLLEPYLPAYRPYFRPGLDEAFLRWSADRDG